MPAFTTKILCSSSYQEVDCTHIFLPFDSALTHRLQQKKTFWQFTVWISRDLAALVFMLLKPSCIK